MGLDITAYSHLKPVGLHAQEWCENEFHVEAVVYDDFPASFRGIPVLEARRLPRVYDDTGILLGGCYGHTEGTETHKFQAGSYSGYNMWRDDLARQFNPGTDPDGPFYELIWFADNEGCIGPEAAADLLADFRAHAEAYQPTDPTPWPGYGVEKYRLWTRAFELAADGGLVDFH